MAETILFDKVLGCLLAAEIGDAMGAPAENMTYQEIIAQFGEICDFTGSGTDDSALKHILCDAIEHTAGYPNADAWADAWMEHKAEFLKGMFWIPVMNSFWKISGESVVPREAGSGNMASSSSAMCISPMGIINAGNPRQAALETYELASLIHHNFARDGACSMASAVAEAFRTDASVELILRAAVEYLPPRSSQVMRGMIADTLALARDAATYPNFRERYYRERILPGIAMPDARETVPVALSLFFLAKGDPRQTILYGANFGHDADTIASMAGALAGALHGASALPTQWVEKSLANSRRDQMALAAMLVDVTLQRGEALARTTAQVKQLQSIST